MTRLEYIFGAGAAIPKKEGRINVDRLNLPNIDKVWNLEKFSYPFPDSSGIHINCSHVIEHLNPSTLPMFFDECWRILNPGGTLYIETPHLQHIDLTGSDPTHFGGFTAHTFINYLTIEGVRKFAYTKKAWAILDIRPHWDHLTGDAVDVIIKSLFNRLMGSPAPLQGFDQRGILKVLLMPIPKSYYPDEILKRYEH